MSMWESYRHLVYLLWVLNWSRIGFSKEEKGQIFSNVYFYMST